MSSLEHLERYLRVQIADYHMPYGDEETSVPRFRPFITISRQAGAGGHTVADRLIELFNEQPNRELFGEWQIFDQKLCEIVASDPGFSKSLDSLLSEEYRSRVADVVHSLLRSSLDQDYVMTRVFHVVRALASVGKAIIVGRGGAQMTAGMSTGVRMRLVAPVPDRVQGVMSYYGLDEREAKGYARKLDGDRARLIRSHFDADIDDPTQYDVVWNTGSSSPDEIGVSVMGMLRARMNERVVVD